MFVSPRRSFRLPPKPKTGKLRLFSAFQKHLSEPHLRSLLFFEQDLVLVVEGLKRELGGRSDSVAAASRKRPSPVPYITNSLPGIAELV
jgi:hypothetical protein